MKYLRYEEYTLHNLDLITKVTFTKDGEGSKLDLFFTDPSRTLHLPYKDIPQEELASKFMNLLSSEDKIFSIS